jgi:hypothetical protein
VRITSRKNPPGRYWIGQLPEYITYFDFESQTLESLYHIYKEEIEEKIEHEQFIIPI